MTDENKKQDNVKTLNKWGEAKELDLKYPPERKMTNEELRAQIGHDVKIIAENTGALLGNMIGRSLRGAAVKIARLRRK